MSAAVGLRKRCRSRVSGSVLAYSTRAHRLGTQKFDSPGHVVGPAPMAALEPAYPEGVTAGAQLEKDIKTLLEARIPLQQLRELGKQKLTGRAHLLWQNHVAALESKLSVYSKELVGDLSLYQLADNEITNFPSWSMAVRELFRAAKASQEKEERYRRDSVNFTLNPASSRLAAGAFTTASAQANVAETLDRFHAGLSFDHQGFPLLGSDWEVASANRKGEFHWSDQPVVMIAVRNLRTALQPPTAAGAIKSSLFSVLDGAPTAVLLERLLLIDFTRRKLILSERVARGDAGTDFDPAIRHAEAWRALSTRITSLFDAPMSALQKSAAAASSASTAPLAPTPPRPAQSSSPLSPPSELISSLLQEGDRLKKPIVEMADRILNSLKEEIRVVDQLALKADTGGGIPASLPMQVPDIEALLATIRNNTISQVRLSSSTVTDRVGAGIGITPVASRSLRPSTVVSGLAAVLSASAQGQLDDIKIQLVQLLEVLATNVARATEAFERRTLRDNEAGITSGTLETETDLESLGLPTWRQRVYTIPPNLLLSLKQVNWPRSQHELYESDRALLRKFSSTRDVIIAVGADNSWTDHVQQLRRALGPDIADLSQMAAINEAAAAAAAALSSRPSPASATASSTAAAAGSSS